MRPRDLHLRIEDVAPFLAYDPATGDLRWKDRPPQKSFSRSLIGTVAGHVGKHGCRQVNLAGRMYKAHRLAWLLMTGEMPTAEVDHRNGCRDDNRWENLRGADHYQNTANARLRRDNTAGLKGVSYWQRSGRWKAQIQVRGVKVFLGYHQTKEAAHAAYVAAAQRLHGEFARAA